ncbi:uncharacterized protein LOC114294110 isoform X1 [Camellia sinensis]|uniref:uncharacterized protein LOC114294110 isoform X1 n=1 Tax=Camellia sinensis TaxID=4442 RepID=UPI001035EE98|nr:uncharacterized protein LOC114294110 isoform X1 [Camellia sinensis]
MGDLSMEVMEENRDASQEAKVLGKLEEAIEQLTQAILLNPTSAIMYSGSLIAIASAEVFFEELYHALGQHSWGHKRKATIKDKGGNKRTYTMEVEEEEERDDDELDLLLFFALILTQSITF